MRTAAGFMNDFGTSGVESNHTKAGGVGWNIFSDHYNKRAWHQKENGVSRFDDENMISILREEEKMRYRFLALFMDREIERLPKSVELRIHSSFIQSAKLKNEFKAIFELMKCERDREGGISFQNKFFIFRRRIYIEKCILMKNQMSLMKGDKIDPMMVYKNEKLYQRFTKVAYLAANYSLSFWRELSQKTIDSQILQEKGCEVSKCFEKSHELALEVQKIFPNEIKFLLNYAIYLKQIVHNDQEAHMTFEKAWATFHRMVPRGTNHNGEAYYSQNMDSSQFGENSAMGIIMISLSAEKVGMMIHSNDEIARVIGHKKRDLIGKSVNIIQPPLLGAVHDSFLTRFLETAKHVLLNNSRELLALTDKGYLRPIMISIKLYPQMSDKIIIIGFFQSLEKLSDLEIQDSVAACSGLFEQPGDSGLRTENYLKSLPHHYIFTDQKGVISSVSEGIGNEIGMLSRFFNDTDSFHSSINIQDIIEHDYEAQEAYHLLTSESGLEAILNTKSFFERINLEQIPSEIFYEVMHKQGEYHVHLKLREYHFGLVDASLYRVVFLPRHQILKLNPKSQMMGKQESWGQLSNQLDGNVQKNSNEEDLMGMGMTRQNTHLNLGSVKAALSLESYGVVNDMSMSSMSSKSESSNFHKNTFSTIIHDFKCAIGKRETPGHLVIFNRMLLIILALILSISAIEFSLKMKYNKETDDITQQLVLSEGRAISFLSLTQNIRSLIDITNNLEFSQYDGAHLQRIDRFKYLQHLIQNQALKLQDIQDQFSQERSIAENRDSQISLYRLTSYFTTTSVHMSYPIALNTYLNDILLLNLTDNTSYILTHPLELGSPSTQEYLNAIQNKTASNMEKDLFFVLTNGLRNLRSRTREMKASIQEVIKKQTDESEMSVLLIIMILGVVVSSCTLVVAIFQIQQSQKSKQEILQIFALFTPDKVQHVQDICDGFIERFQTSQDFLLYASPIRRISNFGSSSDFHQKCGESEDIQQFEFHQSQLKKENSKQLSRKIIISGIKSDCSQKQNNDLIEETKQEGEPDTYEDSFSENHFIAMKNRDIGKHMYGSLTPWEYYHRQLNFTLDIMKQDVLSSGGGAGGRQSEPNKKRRQFNQSLGAMMVDAKSKKGKHTKKLSLRLKNMFLGRMNEAEDEVIKKKKERRENKVRKQKSKLHKKGGELPSNNQAFDSKVLHSSQNISHRQSNQQDICEDQSESSSRRDNENDFESTMRPLQKQQQKQLSEEEIAIQEILRKKQMLVLSKKENKKSFNMIFLILILTLVFNTYFVFTYMYHHTQLNELQEIQTYTPIYFERFANLLLSYQLLKEKIINLNANYSQLGLVVTDQEYELDTLVDNNKPFWRDLDIDNYFHQRSLEVEKKLANLKKEQRKSFQSMMDFQMLTDSEDFCTNIFGMNVGASEEKITVTKNVQEKLKKIRANAYQIQIDTVIAACNAASEGKLDVVKDLWQKGVDLNLGDYDNRTPLHVACGSGDYEVVEFLVNVAGVNVSPVDRWGATPLCDANPYPPIKQLLLSKGARLGKLQPPYTGVAVEVTDDQFRLFYAAFFGDVKMMENLRLLGWNVNGRDYDGRTALGVAASQGNLEAVKYLLLKGADMNIRDARGNDALDDAIREKRTATIDYLIDQALVRTYCPKFESGLFVKGIQQTIGIFNKKYEDVKIGLNDTQDPDECRAYLGIHPNHQNSNSGPNDTDENPTHRIIEVFTESQELYLYKIIEMQIDKLLQTYQIFVENYKQVSESVFYTFIGIQIITLLLLRKLLISKMKDDVLKSRGILNLIPETFFKEHYKEVQKVVQMMKQ